MYGRILWFLFCKAVNKKLYDTPAPMFRRVMDFQPSGNSAGFRSRKCLVQGGKRVGVQVVHDKYDPVTARIDRIHQIPDFLSPVNCCTVCAHAYMAYAAQRLYECKNAVCAVPDIFFCFSIALLYSSSKRIRFSCKSSILVSNT